MSKRTPRPRRGRLQVENLEARSVPAAFIANGWLHVVGTAGADTAVVTDTNPAAFNSAVVVNVNGVASVFNKVQIPQGVLFMGHGGDDYFSTGLARKVVAYGGDGDDTLHGSGFNDVLHGQSGADEIHGHAGNDSLDGGSHNDSLYGGTGNDYVTGQSGNDYIEDESGNDRLYGYTGNDTVMAGAGNDTLSGWTGADALYGAAGNDKVYGHDGDDYLNGGSGNDTLSGSTGDDELDGSSDNDRLYGHEGDDDLDGGTGNDSLEGGSWDDTLHGGDGNDWMTGQSGHDVLYGDDGNDQMYGYTGNDLLVGGDGNDTLSGWDGNDLLYGREGNDKLYGHAGRDGLMGGNGVDSVDGGSDSDRYLTIGDHAEIASMAGGDATIQFGGPQLWSYGEIETIDGGLARIHHRTGNTILLKDPAVPAPADPKAPRVFVERDAVSEDGYSGETHGNVITMYDEAFGSADWTHSVIVHEIAHMWDTPAENPYTLSGEDVADYFWSLSGWRDDLGDAATGTEVSVGGQTYVKAANGNWWYDEDALFVSGYADSSPTEDFCDTVSAVILGSDFAGGGADPLAPVAKRAWINAWLNNV